MAMEIIYVRLQIENFLKEELEDTLEFVCTSKMNFFLILYIAINLFQSMDSISS